jgi:hypothetical protein
MQLAIIAFAGFVAFAQPPADKSLEQTLYFTNAGTAQNCQELGVAIRTVTSVEQAVVDDSPRSVTVRGTSDQVALAEWLFRELDKPAASQPRVPDSGTHEYRAPGDSDFVARVFYPAHIRNAQNLQEAVNLIRTVVDVQRISPNNAQQAIALRGTAAQVGLVEWLLNALDIPQDGLPAATQRRQSAIYPYPAPPTVLPSGVRAPSREGDTVVRVFYLANTDTPQGVQEIVNTLRTISDIQRMFPYIGSKAVVSRAQAGRDALAEWLLNELDSPAGAQPATAQAQDPVTREFQMSGDSSDIVQVLHFQNATAQELQEIANSIRTKLSMQRIFPSSAKSALALRGTASQVALVGQLIKERNAPAAR